MTIHIPNHCIKFYDKTDNMFRIFCRAEVETFKEELEDISGYVFEYGIDSGIYRTSDSWENSNIELKELSKRHPNILIEFTEFINNNDPQTPVQKTFYSNGNSISENLKVYYPLFEDKELWEIDEMISKGIK